MLVARKADELIEAGVVEERTRVRGMPLEAFSTVYSFWAALAGYEGPRWARLLTKADDDLVLSLRDEKDAGTVLHWALSDDSRARLAEVIAARDAVSIMDVMDKDGCTPLHLAAAGGHAAAALSLLQAGADKDAKNYIGETALHLAALMGHETLALALVAAAADTEATTLYGATPLHYAALGGHEVSPLSTLTLSLSLALQLPLPLSLSL